MNAKAFTLVELLVVISIISFLSSVTISSVQSAAAKARATSMNRAVELYTLFIEEYQNDTGYFPGGTYLPGGYYCMNTPCTYNGNPGIQNAGLNNIVKAHLSPIDLPAINVSGAQFKGVMYHCIGSWVPSQACGWANIYWATDGLVCGEGGSQYYNDGRNSLCSKSFGPITS